MRRAWIFCLHLHWQRCVWHRKEQKKKYSTILKNTLLHRTITIHMNIDMYSIYVIFHDIICFYQNFSALRTLVEKLQYALYFIFICVYMYSIMTQNQIAFRIIVPQKELNILWKQLCKPKILLVIPKLKKVLLSFWLRHILCCMNFFVVRWSVCCKKSY